MTWVLRNTRDGGYLVADPDGFYYTADPRDATKFVSESRARLAAKTKDEAVRLERAVKAEEAPSPDAATDHDLIDQLRAAVEASGLAKRDIARAAGTSRVYLSQVLSRVRVPSVSMVERVAAVCGEHLVIEPRRGRGVKTTGPGSTPPPTARPPASSPSPSAPP